MHLITLHSALHHQPKAEFTDGSVNFKVNRLGSGCSNCSQINVTAVIKPKIPPQSSHQGISSLLSDQDFK